MKKINPHVVFIGLLFVLTLFYLKSLLHSGVILNNIHYINDLEFLSYNTKESLRNWEFPLWTPYFYSGHPLLAIPENYLFDLNLIFILVFRDIHLAMNLALISYLFVAGVGMYLLAYTFVEDRKAAFIAAILFMFNGFVHSFVIGGHINLLEGYALLPFIILFAHKALKGRDWIPNGIFAGIFLALQVLSGSLIMFFYTGLIMAIFFLFNLRGKNFINVLAKATIIGTIIIAVGLGLSSIKLLPSLEFTKMSSRSGKVSFNEFLGHPIEMKNLPRIFISNVGYGDISAAAGIVGIALGCCGLRNYRRRIVLFSAFLVIFSLLLASNSYVSELMYKIPGFDKLRHVERALVLLAFAASILSAFGFIIFSESMKKHEYFTKHCNYIFTLIVAGILVEMLLLQTLPVSAKIIKPDEIGVIARMSGDKPYFRTINLAQKEAIGAAGYNYYSQKGISEVKGGGGIWIPDYVSFVGALQQNPSSKLLGTMNVKYLVSDQALSAGNLNLAGNFTECRECAVWNAFGPYLYENNDYLPRYYMAPNAVLLIGEEPASRQAAYGILSQMNPVNTVLIQMRGVSQYGGDFLGKFAVIMSPKDSNYEIIVNPEVQKLINETKEMDLSKILNSLAGNHKELNVKEYSNNRVIIGLDGGKGWLFASERFAHFPGWRASVNGKDIEIYKADALMSAVYIEGENGDLVFEYSPASFIKGRLISLTTLAAIIGYLAYYGYKNHRSKR